MNKNLTKATALLVVIFSLSACGGGGGTSTAPTEPRGQEINIQRSGLPPDPGSSADATLLGVDSNGNGVRDEVERLMSSMTPDDAVLERTMKILRLQQQYLSAPSIEAARGIICLDQARSEQEKIIYSTYFLESITFDTSERSNAYAQASSQQDVNAIISNLNCEDVL